MGQVIDIRKRIAWVRLRRLLRSGKLYIVQPPPPQPPRPRSDLADALAYAFSSSTIQGDKNGR